uniref:C3H1-type domain-containing protein n=1 Tax=Phytophthora ramorum TaxID=164328 RepID=H3GGM6_PHYRM
MLLSSMDHLGYYSMPKENFLELDASPAVAGPDGYALPAEDMGVMSYLNEENSPKNGTKSSLYKTELCKRFSEFGNCRYGDDEPTADSASPREPAPIPASHGRRLSGVSSPLASTAAATNKSEFSLQSDELWKDFPSASAAPFAGDDLQAQPWSTGLSLSLDSKPFDGAAAIAGDAKDVSGSSSNDEESPRLSVFGRFH